MGCGASSVNKVHPEVSSDEKALTTAAAAGLDALCARLRAAPPPAGPSVSSFSDGEAASWLATTHVCMDAVWEPLVTQLELRISSQGGGGAWDTLSTVELVRLLLDTVGERNVAAVREATGALLATGAALWKRQRACTARALPGATAAESAFPSAPLCRLLGLLAIALCRTVGVEDPAGVARRLSPWTSCRSELGFASPALCALLDGSSKSLLLYVAMVERGDARLKLSVGRTGALWESLPQWVNSPFADTEEAPRSVKLFPRFHAEAGEGHGPRKELFAQLGVQMLHGQTAEGEGGGRPAVLPYVASSRQHWFEPSRERSTDGERLCRFAGWLMGQAVSNRSALEAAAIPPLLYRCMLSPGGRAAVSLELLAEFDPALATGLRGVAGMKADEFAAMCELEDLDPTQTTRDEYVRVAGERLLYGDGVGWQLDALVAGFHHALPHDVLEATQLTPSQLAHAVCGAADGDADFDLRTTFRIALSEEDFVGYEPLSEAVWAVLDRWSASEKRRFVKFVTGSDRLPPSGTEVITLQTAFVDERRGASLGMLPQAHTCDNLLELPNYWRALCELRGVPTDTRGTAAASIVKELEKIVHQRLTTAVNECDVYGLDEGGRNEGGGRDNCARTANATMADVLGPPPGGPLASVHAHGARCGDGARAAAAVASEDLEDAEMDADMDEIESLLADARAYAPSPPPTVPPVVRAASLVEHSVVDITESLSQPRHVPDAAPESLDDLIAAVGVGEGGGESSSLVSPRVALASEPAELNEGGSGDELDDLIHELGVGSSLEPIAPPIAQPQPARRDVPTHVPTNSRYANLTDPEPEDDLDLDFEALDI